MTFKNCLSKIEESKNSNPREEKDFSVYITEEYQIYNELQAIRCIEDITRQTNGQQTLNHTFK